MGAFPEMAEEIAKYGHNPKYLSSVFINPEDVKVNTDIKAVVSKADYVIIVTPSAYLHQSLEPLKRSQLGKKKIILAVKGIVPETLQLISDYMQTQFKVPLRTSPSSAARRTPRKSRRRSSPS